MKEHRAQKGTLPRCFRKPEHSSKAFQLMLLRTTRNKFLAPEVPLFKAMSAVVLLLTSHVDTVSRCWARLPCFELTFVSSNYSLGHSFIPYSFIHLSDVCSTPSPSHLSCWKPIRACLDQLFDQCIDEGSSYLSVSRSSTYDAADVLWGIWGQNSGLT